MVSGWGKGVRLEKPKQEWEPGRGEIRIIVILLLSYRSQHHDPGDNESIILTQNTYILSNPYNVPALCWVFIQSVPLRGKT